MYLDPGAVELGLGDADQARPVGGVAAGVLATSGASTTEPKFMTQK